MIPYVRVIKSKDKVVFHDAASFMVEKVGLRTMGIAVVETPPLTCDLWAENGQQLLADAPLDVGVAYTLPFRTLHIKNPLAFDMPCTLRVGPLGSRVEFPRQRSNLGELIQTPRRVGSAKFGQQVGNGATIWVTAGQNPYGFLINYLWARVKFGAGPTAGDAWIGTSGDNFATEFVGDFYVQTGVDDVVTVGGNLATPIYIRPATAIKLHIDNADATSALFANGVALGQDLRDLNGMGDQT